MTRAAVVGATLATLLAGAAGAAAQERAPDALRETMERLVQRVEQLENDSASDRRRINELEETIARLAVQDSDGPSSTRAADRPFPGGQGNLLNPQITAFFDTGATLSTEGDNEAANRFNIREHELDLRSAVTPRADGVLVVAIGEEIETDDDGTEISTHFELEEAYLSFHTLPGDLSLKAGKFRSSFGRNNLLHTHDLPQVSRPLAVKSFLGPEGLATVGASLSWIVPNPWDRYVELTTELVNADGGEESPILGGGSAENPAVIGHLKLFDDVGETASVELGTSFLYGRTSDDRDSTGYLFGLDATYHWRDPDRPDFRSLLLQAEAFWSNTDLDDPGLGTRRLDRFGAYAFGQYQFAQSWYAGLRYDYTEHPMDPRSDADWATSSWLTWYLTEALRLRLEYQHLSSELAGNRDEEDLLRLSLTFFIGAHPAHPYWVNR